jgi:hypothetical protein
LLIDSRNSKLFALRSLKKAPTAVPLILEAPRLIFSQSDPSIDRFIPRPPIDHPSATTSTTHDINHNANFQSASRPCLCFHALLDYFGSLALFFVTFNKRASTAPTTAQPAPTTPTTTENGPRK